MYQIVVRTAGMTAPARSDGCDVQCLPFNIPSVMLSTNPPMGCWRTPFDFLSSSDSALHSVPLGEGSLFTLLGMTPARLPLSPVGEGLPSHESDELEDCAQLESLFRLSLVVACREVLGHACCVLYLVLLCWMMRVLMGVCWTEWDSWWCDSGRVWQAMQSLIKCALISYKTSRLPPLQLARRCGGSDYSAQHHRQ